MNNVFFNALSGNRPNNMPRNIHGNMMGVMGQFGQLVQRFNQFKSSFTGDPKQEVEKLLQSGEMSQEQYNQLASMATQFQKLM